MAGDEKILHRPAYKGEGFRANLGQYNGRPAIIKTGDQRLKAEKDVLDNFNHPNIPKVLGISKAGGLTRMAMEYMPGQPLDEYIQLDEHWNSRRLDMAKIQTIINGLVDVLKHLRANSYLYRDLNLSHIIIDGARISLVDLEHCVKAKEAGVWRVDNRAGTWETMAHEEFMVGNRLLESTSTYMVGVLVLQLVLGSNPFYVTQEQIPNTEVRRFYVRDLHKQIPEFDAGNRLINEFLTRALQPAPSRRYKTFEDLQAALTHATQLKVK